MIYTALVWCERLLALAILFQTIEMLKLRPAWADNGVWRWSTLRKGYSTLSENWQKFFDTLLNEEAFRKVLLVRLFCCIGVWIIFPLSIFMLALLFTTWLISVRWRGIFNGGSDSMTILIAAALFIGQFFSGHFIIVKACLAYIAIQLTLSYFIAGVAKFKNEEWRKGTVLSAFFNTPRYDSPPSWVRQLMDRPSLAKLASYSVIAFELSFPLAWLSPSICTVYLLAALGFHILNFWIFGLNRFVFAWFAAYPALYYWTVRG